MIRDLSKDLIKAVAEINQKSREAFVAEQKTLHEKMQVKAMKMPGQPAPKADPAAHSGAADMAKKNMKEAAEGTTPKTEKEKKLAAMRPPVDKITHGDVLHGRGVRKEAWEDMLKAVQKRREEQGTGKFDKKETGTGTAYTRKASTFDDGGKDADMKKADKKMKKEEAVVENTDTPGNSTHQCAIHVKSEQFGEGKTLFSQHAEPDASGNIAWYDVMFGEGIKRVKTEDLEILVSEGHMNHKKKKM
jgi:hypothetical protein